jgi:hypothetical protein
MAAVSAESIAGLTDHGVSAQIRRKSVQGRADNARPEGRVYLIA